MIKQKTEDGLQFYYLNDYETRLSYDAIFKRTIYENSNITVRDHDVILDIGANIGLFPLYLHSVKKIKNVRFFAFEPNQMLFEVLTQNIKLSNFNAEIFPVGVTDKNGTEEFVFYPEFTIGSAVSKYADWGDKIFGDFAVHSMRARQKNNELNEKWINRIKKLNSTFVKKEVSNCIVKNISSIIEEYQIPKIDLIKINAENSELDILHGIKHSDWDKIKQLIIEVHDEDNLLQQDIIAILKEKKFAYTIVEDSLGFSSKTKIFLIYSWKNS